jgi:hypothetical protein
VCKHGEKKMQKRTAYGTETTQKSIMSGKSYRRSLGKLTQIFFNKLNQNLYIRPNEYKDFLSNIYIR